MQHLNEEQLVLHHYHDGDGAAQAEEHLAGCAECRAQFETLRRVLALVDTLPVPDRGDGYSEKVWTRLRWKLGSERRRLRHWQVGFAAAAMLAIAFVSGILWHQRGGQTSRSVPVAQTAVQGQPGLSVPPSQTQILFVVVGDHLDASERMLLEVANADTRRSLDMSEESRRAEDLVVSNRIYRQTAAQRGETRIATLLSDIEPVLLELAHAGSTLSPEKLAALQKRIESKGLLFKVRVVSAQVGDRETAVVAKGTNSL
ncbi:MAG: hypothetical protein AABO58_18445 [Acidobacteriota bacterium]